MKSVPSRELGEKKKNTYHFTWLGMPFLLLRKLQSKMAFELVLGKWIGYGNMAQW